MLKDAQELLILYFWQFHLRSSEVFEDPVRCATVQGRSLPPAQIVLSKFLKSLKSFGEDIVSLHTPIKLPLPDELPYRLLGLLGCFSHLCSTISLIEL